MPASINGFLLDINAHYSDSGQQNGNDGLETEGFFDERR